MQRRLRSALRSALPFALLLLAAACSSGRRGSACGDECPSGEICDEDQGECVACTASCGDRACGSDGCGGSCGECLEGEACTDEGLCVECTKKSCEEAGALCGTPPDGCGGTLDCGGCGDTLECLASLRCGPPGCEAKSCSAQGLDCGAADDGCGAALDCGGCPAGEKCGGGGQGKCGTGPCVGETDRAFCLRHDARCGALTAFDNCDASRTVNCGGCTSPQTCGGGGKANVCGCAGAQTDVELCREKDARCGALTAVDRCGVTRNVTCGGCTSPETCGGGGRANVCGCTSRFTDRQICEREGWDCFAPESGLAVRDDCGVVRRPACGSCPSTKTCGGAGLANRCGGWRDMAYPGGDVSQILAFGSNDVWVRSGSFGDDGIWRWNGNQWVTISSGDFDTMGASGPSNVVVADGFSGLARWNGSGFDFDAISNPMNINERALSVATTGPNAIWLATNAGVRFWNGSWGPLLPPTGGKLIEAMWATGNTAWGVGAGGLIQKFTNGTAANVTSPVGVRLSAIHGTSANDIWASGDGFVTIHWDGSRWTKVFELGLDGASQIAAVPGEVWMTGRNTSFVRLSQVDGRWMGLSGSLDPNNMGAVAAATATDIWVGGMARHNTRNGMVYRLLP